MLRKTLFMCFFILVLNSSVFAITVSWDKNTEPDIDHYNVLYKKVTESEYTVIGSTETSVEIPNLSPGKYEFKVIAVDKAGQTSSPSESVNYFILVVPKNMRCNECDK